LSGKQACNKTFIYTNFRQLSHLTSSGLEIRTSSFVQNIFVKLAMGIFNLPAVLNAKQFNGKPGFSVCLHPGNCLSNNS